METMYENDLVRCPHHNTSLNSTKISLKCSACYEEDGNGNKEGYTCELCYFYIHKECINPNIPSRHKHPLQLTSSHSVYDSCCLCESYRLALLYQCLPCAFRICIQCVRKPLILKPSKAHKHELRQVPMKISFTCDACGLCSSHYPCICHQCCFIIHRKCIFLPRVIYINRHDHRVSHVSSLGPGSWICGVCRAPVNREYGAYSCLICAYAVHSKCATDLDIWDEIELEGISEEEEEEEEGKAFEIIDQNLIKHFSHQHNLKVSLGLDEDKHCYACTLSFNSERCYICTQCDFILHEACANLPMRKRHPISSGQLTLYAGVRKRNYFLCRACLRYCTGFSYTRNNFNIDVQCAFITDALKHESHPHWLFPFISDVTHYMCTVCDSLHEIHLRCINHHACGRFSLCFKCATLPKMVRHKYDDHPLSLCYLEGNVNSIYCCGVCEEEVNPKSGFYWCSDCNSTLHTTCVFKNLLHPRPGYNLVIHDKGTFEILPNNSLSRPICCVCKTRCMGDLVMNNKADTNVFMCPSCGFPEY